MSVPNKKVSFIQSVLNKGVPLYVQFSIGKAFLHLDNTGTQVFHKVTSINRNNKHMEVENPTE